MTRANAGETCGDTALEGYVCTLPLGHLSQHYDHEHHHWPLAPPAAGETVEDIECEDREFLAALVAPGEASAAPPPGETQKENDDDQESFDIRPIASPIIGAAIVPVDTNYTERYKSTKEIAWDLVDVLKDLKAPESTIAIATRAAEQMHRHVADMPASSPHAETGAPTDDMARSNSDGGILRDDRVYGVGDHAPDQQPTAATDSRGTTVARGHEDKDEGVSAVAPPWPFSASAFEMAALSRYTHYTSSYDIYAMLRSAAALRREVERLSEQVEFHRQTRDDAIRHATAFRTRAEAAESDWQAAEREVERLTKEKNEASSDSRQIERPITGTAPRRRTNDADAGLP